MSNELKTAALKGKPRRRWFQFGLGTLLVVVALLSAMCAYVAHEARIVGERRAMLKRITAGGGQVFCAAEEQRLLRRLLGDVGNCSIVYPGNFSDADKARLAELFPDDWIGPNLQP